jgi:hypothetical protein
MSVMELKRPVGPFKKHMNFAPIAGPRLRLAFLLPRPVSGTEVAPVQS